MPNIFTKAIDYFFPNSNQNEEGITANDEKGLGYYSFLGSRFEVNPDGTVFYAAGFGNYKEKPSETELLNVAYANNPYVFTIVNKISKKTASLPVRFVNKDTDEEATLNSRLQDLLKSPDSKFSFQELVQKLAASYLVTGNGFLVGVNETIGFPFNRLYVPVSNKVTITEDQEGNPTKYNVSYYNFSGVYEPENVLHLLNPDITEDRERGFSVLTAARQVYLANNALWNNERNLHEQGGANGFVTNSGTDSSFALTPKEQMEDQKAFDRMMGNSKFGKNIMLKGSYDFKQMSLDPAKLKSVETKIDHLRTIAEIYDYPSVLAGDTNNSTYNNIATARIMAMENVYLPLADYIYKNISQWLIQENFGFEQIEMQVDREQISELNEVDKEFSDKVVNELNAGVIDAEIARQLIYPDFVDNEDENKPSNLNEEEGFEDNQQAESANELAQANLRGSVGGVQGILEVQAAVANGVTQRSAALTILMEIYGFELATAEAILGDEVDLSTLEIPDDPSNEN